MKKSEGKKKTVTTRSRSKSDLSGIIDEHFLILDLDSDREILTANKKFLNTSGYRLIGLKKKPISDCFEIGQSSLEKIDAFWNTRDPNKKELGRLQLNCKMNKFVNVRAEAIQVFDHDKKLKKIILILSETVDRVAEPEKEEQVTVEVPVAQKDQKHLENVEWSIVLSRWSPEGYLSEVGEAFLILTGLSGGQLNGRHVSDLVSDISYSGENWSESWRRAGSGHVGHCCINMSHLNGTAHPFYMTLIAVKDADGQLSQVTGLAADVLPLIEKIDELTNRVNCFEADRISATETIATADFDLEGQIVDCNKDYLNNHDKSEKNLSGFPLNHLITSWTDQINSQAEVWYQLKKGIEVTEISIRQKNNSEHVGLKSYFIPVKNQKDEVIKIREFAPSAASATEEQAATTEDAIRIVTDSNRAVQNIIDQISGVISASANTAKRADHTIESVHEFESISKRLKAIVPLLKEVNEGKTITRRKIYR